MTKTETPKMIATSILSETETHWNVKCEHAACPNGIAISKTFRVPVDFANPTGEMRTVVRTAPGRRFCGKHA